MGRSKAIKVIMNKMKYRARSRALRKVLRGIWNDEEGLRYSLPFGAALKQNEGTWVVFNRRTRNVIGAIRFVEPMNIWTVRYRENSWYAPILRNFEVPNIETRHAIDNLNRYNDWARVNIEPTLRMLRITVLRSSRVQEGSDVRMIYPGEPEEAVYPDFGRRIQPRDSRGRFTTIQPHGLRELYVLPQSRSGTTGLMQEMAGTQREIVASEREELPF